MLEVGIRTKDGACNLRGDIVRVILSLFVKVIFVYSGLIPSRKARYSYRLLNKADILLLMQTPFDRRYGIKKTHISNICLILVHRKKCENYLYSGLRMSVN